MPTQRRAAALLNGRHDLELAQTQVTLVSLAPSRSVSTEDVGDLQGGPHHDALYGAGKISIGETTSRRISVPTCV
jgi:hypothetical protein